MSVVLLGSTSGSITLQEPAVAGTNTVNFGANTGVAILDANTPAFRNRILNGSMVLDQRNAGASVTPADGTYTLDRWRVGLTQASKFSVQQNSGSVTPPSGFKSYLGVVSLSAYSLTSGDLFMLQHKIEGYNVADLMLGTASAATFTLSFWVRSSLTGLFGGSLINNASDRSYPFSYTINSANTWEQKSVTITGDTSGTWLETNGNGLELRISLGAGTNFSGTAGAWVGLNLVSATSATSVVGTNGATFYITGVQLEKGSTATSFDYRSYGTELALCQRYFWKTNPSSLDARGGFTGGFHNTTTFATSVSWPVTMRAIPTISRSATRDNFYVAGVSASLTATTVSPNIDINGAWTEFSSASPTAGLGYTASYNGQLSVSAEL